MTKICHGCPLLKRKVETDFCCDLVGITSLRSVFPSSAGHHDKNESASCMRRTAFFVIRRPVQEQALDGPTYNKKAQP